METDFDMDADPKQHDDTRPNEKTESGKRVSFDDKDVLRKSKSSPTLHSGLPKGTGTPASEIEIEQIPWLGGNERMHKLIHGVLHDRAKSDAMKLARRGLTVTPKKFTPFICAACVDKDLLVGIESKRIMPQNVFVDRKGLAHQVFVFYIDIHIGDLNTHTHIHTHSYSHGH